MDFEIKLNFTISICVYICDWLVSWVGKQMAMCSVLKMSLVSINFLLSPTMFSLGITILHNILVFQASANYTVALTDRMQPLLLIE